jgi:DNA-binding NarL/FixJ family response regulator
MNVRLVIADDQAVVRSGFKAILEDEPDIEIVGEAEDGVQAVAVARRRAADLVLMDVRMPRMNGLEATRELAGEIDVLIVTTFDLDEYVFGALRAGAAGFLLKDAPADTLIAAIRAVGGGQGLIAPEVTRRLISRFAEVSPRDATATAGELSEREQQVLLLVARGRTNAQIGSELMIEETTVKTHVSAVLSKLGLQRRVQAVIYAYETGLVTPGG